MDTSIREKCENAEEASKRNKRKQARQTQFHWSWGMVLWHDAQTIEKTASIRFSSIMFPLLLIPLFQRAILIFNREPKSAESAWAIGTVIAADWSRLHVEVAADPPMNMIRWDHLNPQSN